MGRTVRYSEEERKFIEKYFSVLSTEELHSKYVKVFGPKRTAKGIESYGKYIGLKKEYVNHFSEEETEWIKENYKVYEPNEITYQKFCNLFGNNHTFIAFMGKVKQLRLHKDGKMTMIQYKWLQNHDEIPKDCYLVDFGTEVIDVPKDIYNCLNARNLLGKGEVTKTMIEIYKAKKMVEQMTHKKLFNYHPTEEHIAKMRAAPKTYHKKFEGEKLEELKRLKGKGLSDRKLALIFGVRHRCVGDTLKRERRKNA